MNLWLVDFDWHLTAPRHDIDFCTNEHNKYILTNQCSIDSITNQLLLNFDDFDSELGKKRMKFHTDYCIQESEVRVKIKSATWLGNIINRFPS